MYASFDCLVQVVVVVVIVVAVVAVVVVVVVVEDASFGCLVLALY